MFCLIESPEIVTIKGWNLAEVQLSFWFIF